MERVRQRGLVEDHRIEALLPPVDDGREVERVGGAKGGAEVLPRRVRPRLPRPAADDGARRVMAANDRRSRIPGGDFIFIFIDYWLSINIMSIISAWNNDKI